ncbi:hypothetical protein QQG74_09490 [Micromonospora sp. FIMYZ51]
MAETVAQLTARAHRLAAQYRTAADGSRRQKVALRQYKEVVAKLGRDPLA